MKDWEQMTAEEFEMWATDGIQSRSESEVRLVRQDLGTGEPGWVVMMGDVPYRPKRGGGESFNARGLVDVFKLGELGETENVLVASEPESPLVDEPVVVVLKAEDFRSMCRTLGVLADVIPVDSELHKRAKAFSSLTVWEYPLSNIEQARQHVS